MQRSLKHESKQEKEIQILKQEIMQLKGHQDRLDQLQEGNTELIKQRRALLDKVERHNEEKQENQVKLVEAQTKYKEA